MTLDRLKLLLAQFASECPDRPLSEVTMLQFAEWYAQRELSGVRQLRPRYLTVSAPTPRNYVYSEDGPPCEKHK